MIAVRAALEFHLKNAINVTAAIGSVRAIMYRPVNELGGNSPPAPGKSLVPHEAATILMTDHKMPASKDEMNLEATIVRGEMGIDRSRARVRFFSSLAALLRAQNGTIIGEKVFIIPKLYAAISSEPVSAPKTKSPPKSPIAMNIMDLFT